jgi:PilZ domain
MRWFGVSEARGRRSVPRAQAPLVAVLSMSAGDHPVKLVDISRTGARLRGKYLPAVGQQGILKAEKIKVAAEVVWRDSGGCALEFDTPIAVPEVQRLRCLGLWCGSSQ